MIPDQIVDAVKERVDARTLFARHLVLRRSGSGFVAACPFHEDRSPSLRFYPEQARFHCFGCGARGDVFAFLQRLHGKSFPAVVRELAVEMGVPLEEPPPGPGERVREEIVAACAAAQDLFEDALWSPRGAAGRSYLLTRGISEATAREMRLGFGAGDLATSGGLAVNTSRRGLLLAGLVAEQGEALRERFEERLTFPLHDANGRILGFAGRSLQTGTFPVYLTTSENAAFKQARVLFGLEQASASVRRTGRALLVPAYFDVLACRQAGLDHAVSGSGLSFQQLGALRRRGARRITVLASPDREFDPGPALTAQVFLSGASVWVASVPPSGRYRSAESFLRASGRAGLEALEAAALPLSEYLIGRALHAKASVGARVEGRLAAIGWLARYTAALPEGLERDVLERRIAERLALPLRTVRRATRDAGERRAPGSSGPRPSLSGRFRR